VKEDEDSVKRTAEEIESAGGFPNFFGVQRFGIMRPITHTVGKYILLGDMEKAVMTYVANPIEGEDESSYNARKFLEDNMDFAIPLREKMKAHTMQESFWKITWILLKHSKYIRRNLYLKGR